MEFGTEFVGTKLAVIFDVTVPTAQRHTELARVGNPVLESTDSVGLYIVAVPDGQGEYWKRRYKMLPGIVEAQVVIPTFRQVKR